MTNATSKKQIPDINFFSVTICGCECSIDCDPRNGTPRRQSRFSGKGKRKESYRIHVTLKHIGNTSGWTRTNRREAKEQGRKKGAGGVVRPKCV